MAYSASSTAATDDTFEAGEDLSGDQYRSGDVDH